MRNPELRFDIQNLHKTYPSSTLSELGAKTVLRLDSEFGLNTFIKFINEAFIPQLQETYAKQHNFFLENLVMKSHHRNDKLQYWDLKFDPYALKDNPVLGHNFNTAAKDFEKIADIPSGILAPNGTELTIGEVFYLYNVITSKGLTTGLGTIAHSSGENKNVFPISKDEENAIEEWKKKHDEDVHGLTTNNLRMKAEGVSGGRYSYHFVPTALGTSGVIKCSCGAKFEFQEIG